MDAPPVSYFTTSDGYNIAYAVVGEGDPLVFLPTTFSHIQLYWTQQTFLRPWLEGLATRFRLAQYDGRGQGMSTRGLAEDFSVDTDEHDLENIVDRLQLRHFVLMATTWHSHTAVRYAAKNSDRVRGLVLASAPVSGSSWPRGLWELLPDQHWDLFLLTQLPRGYSYEETERGLERLKLTTIQSDHEIRSKTYLASDIKTSLPQLACPTLILQARDYAYLSKDEPGKLAALIPDARVVWLDGDSFMGDAEAGLRAIDNFRRDLDKEKARAAFRSRSPNAPSVDLSSRELEVLRLIAAGRSNPQIAEELAISINTVQRHVSNILSKAGLANRTEAASYAHLRGLA